MSRLRLFDWVSRRNLFSRTQVRNEATHSLRKTAKHPVMERLEERTLLAAYLFVDFGDNFPGGTLSTTQGAFRDVADDADPAKKILGTDLRDSANGFNAATALNIVAQTFTAAARAQMMAVVERAYRPLDIAVVELTASVLTTADGRNVRGAASMADVINTLRTGDEASKDAYVFVATFVVDPGGANQQTYGPGGGGLSPDSPTLGVASDLASASNTHDDVAVVYSAGGFSNNTMNNISHEAGHLFGLQHAITNASTSAAINLFHQAEIMSYRNTNNTTSSVAFTRFPMIRGDDNSPGAGANPVNYNDLAARNGQVTLYDQVRLDPNVGPNPKYSFVSGTGAHDIITITRNGAFADVSIQAFADAAYTTPITVPGEADSTYSYSFPLINSILVFAGDSNDRIVVDADLGVDVEIDGMLGTDTLIVNGKNAANINYTPHPTAPVGADLINSFGGTLSVGSSSIFFENFETAGSVTVQNVNTVTYVTPAAGVDNLTVNIVTGLPQVAGTVNDGTSVVPLLLQSVSRLAVDTGNANDILTVDTTNGLITLSNGIHYDGGAGADRLELRQTGGAQTSETITVGATPGSGTDTIIGASGTQVVQFENLEPIISAVPAPDLFIDGALVGSLLNADNAINYDTSDLFGAAWGRVTIDAFEPIHFTNKDNLHIDAENGSDEINLNNPNIPTGFTPGGLKTINVNGDDPTASDTLIVNAVSGSAQDNLRIQPTAQGAGTVDPDRGAYPTVNYTGIEKIEAVLQFDEDDAFSLDGTEGDDFVQIVSGPVPGLSAITGVMNLNNAPADPFTLPHITVRNNDPFFGFAGVYNFFGVGGLDDFEIYGTGSNDTFSVEVLGQSQIDHSVNGQVINFFLLANADEITLDGGDGDDTFDVPGNLPDTLRVLGGNPSASDTLNFIGVGAGLITVNYEDRTVSQVGTTSFSGIEHLNIDANDAPVTLLGEDTGPDRDETFTIRPQSGATSPVRFERAGDNTLVTVEDVGAAALTLNPRLGVDTINYEDLESSQSITVTYGATTTIANSGGLQTVGISSTFTSVLNVNGNSGDDTITLIGDATVLATSPRVTNVNAGAGHDTVNASAVTAGGLVIRGEDGNDILRGGAGDDLIFGGSGNDILVGGAGADSQYGEDGNDIFGNLTLTADGVADDPGADSNYGGAGFDNFIWEPGDGPDFNNGGEDGADIFRFFGNAMGNTFTLRPGGTPTHFNALIGALVIDNHGIEDVIVDGQGGADTFTVDDLFVTEVKTINLNLGPADAAVDAVTVNGRDIADEINITAGAAAGSVRVQGLRYDVNLTNSEVTDTLTVNGNDGDDVIKAAAGVEATIAIALNGGAGNDFLSADATLNGGVGNDTLIGGAGNDTINGGDGDDTIDGRGGVNTVDGGLGNDTFLVTGTAAGEAITTTHVAGTLTIAGGISAGVNNFSTMERVHIESLEGDDTITLNVLGAGGLDYEVRGGNPIGAPGDVLVINAPAPTTFTPGPENDAGSVDIATTVATTVSFDEIESLTIDITVPGSATVMGTGADDDITAEGVAPNTVTVQVNDGPKVTYAGATAITLQGKNGDDDITIDINVVALAVAFIVDGGLPASGSDELRVTGVDGFADQPIWIPDAPDGGTLLLGTQAPILVDFIERLFYDGESDGDFLTVVGTVLDDTIIHTPGLTNDSGRVAVNSLLAINYEEIGVAGGVVIEGGGAAVVDTLVVNGTAGVDRAEVLAISGIVGLFNQFGVHVPIIPSNIQSLGIELLEGDDFAVINAPLFYQAITILGDGPGDSDELIVNGGAATAEAMVVTPGTLTTLGFFASQPGFGTVSINTVPVSYLGVEHLWLQGGGTAGDTLLVNDNFADNVWNVLAGTVADRIQIDALESIEYSGFEDVTLESRFGTDLFNIYPSNLFGYSASFTINGDGGLPSDDVLRIFGTPGADVVTSTATTITTNGVSVTAGVNLVAVHVLTLDGDDRIDLDLNLAGVGKVVDAGAGDDSVDMSGTLDATIFGGIGDDTIIGTALPDYIYGDDSVLNGGGNDSILGLGGIDTIFGGEGNDTVTGGTGNDLFFGGDGSDTFIWNPGDNSDVLEGGSNEADVLIFNGSPVVETFHIFADLINPTRARLTRDVGGVTMDLAGIEQIDLNTDAGTDTVTVGRANDGVGIAATLSDLTTTDVTVVNIDLRVIATGLPDAVADNVFVDGRPLDDNMLVSLMSTTTGIVKVAGLEYDVRIRGSNLGAVGTRDRLTVRGNEGDDKIKSENPTVGVSPSVESVIDITLDGGDGDDFLSADAIILGGAGNDTLIGGAGNDTLDGGPGDDILRGEGADDSMIGGPGEDTFVGGLGNDTVDGGADFDTILITGTSGNDLIVVDQTAPTTLVYTVNGATETDTLVTVGGVRTVERARIEAGDGDDVITVTWADVLGFDGFVNSLRMDVVGGADFTRDRLGVIDNATGDLVLYRKGESDSTGSMTVGPANAEPLEAVFQGIEYAEPVLGAGGQTVVFKHDPFEFNNSQFIATHLGADHTINIDPTIDPGVHVPTGLPADQDFYRFEARVTGTLDFQVFFEEIPTVPSGRPGLPGNGNLNIELYDRDGTLIAGAGPNFGGNDGGGLNPELNLDGEPFFEDERIRIPAVQGQVYYLRVFGATPTTINNYTMTIVNAAPPVPYDIELDDFPVIVPASPVEVCTQPAGLPAGEENSDSGRSQFDNVTCDRTPTIRFRLDDGIFLFDLPGNDAIDSPPDEVIPIQKTDQDGVPAGYRVAVFIEGAPQQPGTLPQTPIGFATRISTGVYEFTFPATAVVCPDGVATAGLCDGSHFISARVQMLDPATPQQTGFGDRSVSLEIVVDATDPTLTLALDPQSESGVGGQPFTFTDEIINDTTPSFLGRAEANTVVRIFLDDNGNNTFDPPGSANPDLLIGTTVAVPIDGTNQFPNGQYNVTSTVDLNDPALGLGFDGRRVIFATAEDLAGNIGNTNGAGVIAALEIFLDTQGPQVTNVYFDPIDPALPLVNVFNPKPVITGPTPLTRSIRIDVQDLPARAAALLGIPGGDGPFGFQYPAVNEILAEELGNFLLVGDQNGVIEIVGATFTSLVNCPPAAPVIGLPAPGSIACGYITLDFGTPLPDDRYTLTVFDRITDEAGNALDGEANTSGPTDVPNLPSGDGNPGDSFIARFTVDSRPEIGTFCCASWYIDLNGNGTFDNPNNHDTDAINGDIVFKFGLPGDFPVVGDWDGNGFDEIGVYGRRADGFRFELDLNGNGAFDAGDASFLFGRGGRPVAGRWNVAGPGDHVAVYDGRTWFVDLSPVTYSPATGPVVPATLFVSSVRGGRPVAGNFNGSLDGRDEVGLYLNNNFLLDTVGNDFTTYETTINFGFNTPLQLPTAADWDADGEANIGIYAQERNGMFPREAAEWYLDLGVPYTGPLGPLMSGLFGGPGGTPIANPGDGLFQPPPTGGLPTDPDLPLVFQDLFYQFGDELAEPVAGNFDPPSGDPVHDAIIRPLVRLDDSNQRGADATPLFIWDTYGGTSESAEIATSRDRDVFQFTALENGRVVIEAAKSGSSVDTNLLVSSSAGRKIAKASNTPSSTDARVEIDVVAGETYYITVYASKRTAGAYQLSLDYLLDGAAGTPDDDTDHGNTASTATKIEIPHTGARASGAIDIKKDVDFFRFTASSNGRLAIAATTPTSLVDPVLELLDSAGGSLVRNDNVDVETTDSRVVWDVVAGETYFIRLSAASSKTGDYELALDWLLS